MMDEPSQTLFGIPTDNGSVPIWKVRAMNGLPAILRAEEAKKLAVWKKGHPIAGWSDSVLQYDDFGNVIRYADYGNRQSEYGWEFDHIYAMGLGGADQIWNLRPLHYKTNAGLGALQRRYVR